MGEMNLVGFISFTLISTVLSWPRGAPRCDIRPGHGAQAPDNLNVAVNKMGPAEWKITLPGSFKGIILNSATEGSWDETGFGFKVQSSCVTHSNSLVKSSTDFVFVTANLTATPSFSGYVVFARNSYAALVFPLIIM